MKPTLYRTLRAWRREKGLSQANAAQFIGGISQSYYHKIESGSARPRPDYAKRIIKRTGVSIEALMGWL